MVQPIRTYISARLKPFSLSAGVTTSQRPSNPSRSATLGSFHILVAELELDFLRCNFDHQAGAGGHQLKLHLARPFPMDSLSIEQVDQRPLADPNDHEVLIVMDLRIVRDRIPLDHNLRAWLQIVRTERSVARNYVNSFGVTHLSSRPSTRRCRTRSNPAYLETCTTSAPGFPGLSCA